MVEVPSCCSLAWTDVVAECLGLSLRIMCCRSILHTLLPTSRSLVSGKTFLNGKRALDQLLDTTIEALLRVVTVLLFYLRQSLPICCQSDELCFCLMFGHGRLSASSIA
jgi:hypothetical protein